MTFGAPEPGKVVFQVLFEAYLIFFIFSESISFGAPEPENGFPPYV